MLNVFIAICVLMPWFSIGSMDMKGLEEHIGEIRKMEGQDYVLQVQMENLEKEKFEYDVDKTKLDERKQMLNQEKNTKKSILNNQKEVYNAQKRDLDQQKQKLQEEKQTKLTMGVNPAQKGSIQSDYAQRIAQIDIQKSNINIKKSQLDVQKGGIDRDIESKKSQIDIQKSTINIKKGNLRDKISNIQNEQYALSKNKIEKQIKVTKLMKEQFEMFESKIDDERKKEIIKQKTKFFNSMKKNEKKSFNSYQTISSFGDVAINFGNVTFGNEYNFQGCLLRCNTMSTHNGETYIDGKEYKKSKNEIFYGGKRYLLGNHTIENGKVYINGKEAKPLDEEKKSAEDKSKDESEFFVDIGVLEESYKFLMELEQNCEKNPKNEIRLPQFENETLMQETKIEKKEIRIRVPKIEEEKTVDTGAHMKEEKIENQGIQIEKDIQNNTKTNQKNWGCSCCQGDGKKETIRYTKQ